MNRAAEAQSPLRFRQLTAGSNHTCGLHVDGTVWCWGRHQEGQLGIGAGPTAVPVPTQVPGLQGITELVAYAAQTCAVGTTLGVSCWGADGDRSWPAVARSTSTPEPISFFTAAPAAVSPGRYHTCFLLQDQTVHCQGSNVRGQLGGGIQVGPQSIEPVWIRALLQVRTLATGSWHTCALDLEQMAWCWGDYLPRQGAFEPVNLGIGPLSGLAAGEGFTCGLVPLGQVLCWGVDDFGQLGNGTLDTGRMPVWVNGMQEAEAITAGAFHACALLQDRQVQCWGANTMGQLGNGSTRMSSIPVGVITLENVKSITAGAAHTCALLEDQTAVCWGSNHEGQLGTGSRANALTPEAVSPSLSPF